MQALLHIEQLSVNFNTENGVVTALDDVSFAVNQGEVVAVVGESGSGKTVTAMSVLQLLPPQVTQYKSGRIDFYRNGTPVNLLQAPSATLPGVRGHEIAMIFQEPMTSLNPVLRCGRQVAEVLVRHKKLTMAEALRQTRRLFEQVQLPNPDAMLRCYPHEISGGQKQRVMIAMAMSCQPRLLICDEPTTALDVTVQQNILQLIKQLQRENGMGVLFISHDLGLVAEIADRIVVMYRGKIVEQGPAAAMLQQPLHPYTKALLACRPVLYPKGTRLPVVSDFMEANGTGYIPPAVKPETIAGTVPVATTPLVKVSNLRVSYPAARNFLGKPLAYNHAVNDVSFDMMRGETVGLVGESGCGKTTLGRALLLLNRPSAGTIHYNGQDISGIKGAALKRFRKEVQIVFQDPYSSLNPRLTIGDAIAEPMAVHGIGQHAAERRDAVVALLEKVQLSAAHFKRYPHEFSGGQRQRIVIARALALNPGFVVCDESVSALDVSVQAQVLNLLNDLKQEFGFTVLFISHDLGVVQYISDRIMVMQKGIIVESNIAGEIYNRPQHAYTQQLIAAVPGRGGLKV